MEKDRSRNVYIYRPFYSFLSRYRIQDYSTNLFYETYTVNIYTGPGYISTYHESSSLFPPIYIIGGDYPTTVSLLLRLFCATGEERSDYTFSRSWGSTKKVRKKRVFSPDEWTASRLKTIRLRDPRYRAEQPPFSRFASYRVRLLSPIFPLSFHELNRERANATRRFYTPSSSWKVSTSFLHSLRSFVVSLSFFLRYLIIPWSSRERVENKEEDER